MPTNGGGPMSGDNAPQVLGVGQEEVMGWIIVGDLQQTMTRRRHRSKNDCD